MIVDCPSTQTILYAGRTVGSSIHRAHLLTLLKHLFRRQLKVSLDLRQYLGFAALKAPGFTRFPELWPQPSSRMRPQISAEYPGSLCVCWGVAAISAVQQE